MRPYLLSIVALLGTSVGVEASCVDPSTLVRSTVSMTRTFDEEDRRATPGSLGVRGTGWFLSPKLLATAGHVAEGMRLSRQNWKVIELRERDNSERVLARVHLLVGSYFEQIAVVELRTPRSNAVLLPIRTEPLVPEEAVVSLAYPHNQLRFARGRFVGYGVKEQFFGAALLEMHDGNDRLVLDHGASGAPVLDCEGRVIAVISTLITQTLNLPFGAVRVSTAWQTPNVVSMPAEGLRNGTSLNKSKF